MPTYIKGEKVANATSYELHEKVGGSYNKLAEKNEINFEVSALGLAGGNHTLVVKAKAEGYVDSEYSNELTYTVGTPALDVPFVLNSVWYQGEPLVSDHINGRARTDGAPISLSKAVAADGIVMIFSVYNANGTYTDDSTRIMNKTGTFTDFDSTKKYHVTFYKGDASTGTQTDNITQEELDSGNLIQLYA